MDKQRPGKRWELEWEHDMLMAFWLAIDRNNLPLVRHLASTDLSLRYIAVLNMKRKLEKPKGFTVSNKTKAKPVGLGGVKKESGSGHPLKEEKIEEHQSHHYSNASDS